MKKPDLWQNLMLVLKISSEYWVAPTFCFLLKPAPKNIKDFTKNMLPLNHNVFLLSSESLNHGAEVSWEMSVAS